MNAPTMPTVRMRVLIARFMGFLLDPRRTAHHFGQFSADLNYKSPVNPVCKHFHSDRIDAVTVVCPRARSSQDQILYLSVN